MKHPIYRVTSFEIVAPHTLRVMFDDDTVQVIDFSPILYGKVFGPLRDLSQFNRVEIDPEVHTLVWENGADLDPTTLHDWPKYRDAMKTLAQGWAEKTEASSILAIA